MSENLVQEKAEKLGRKWAKSKDGIAVARENMNQARREVDMLKNVVADALVGKHDYRWRNNAAASLRVALWKKRMAETSLIAAERSMPVSASTDEIRNK